MSSAQRTESMPPVSADASPRLRLPYLQPAQAQKHVTHNEALQRLDALVQLRVAAWAVASPPAGPAPGDVVEVGPAAADAFAGQAGMLALWDGTGWQFLEPRDGWLAWDAGTSVLRVRTGGAWQAWAGGAQSSSGPSGRVLRWADGTQTCWHTLTTSAAGDVTWTFPQPFASAAGLAVTLGVGGGAGPLVPRHAAKGAASVALSVLDPAGNRVAASLDVVAQGRWL
jgi:hypothetical protein